MSYWRLHYHAVWHCKYSDPLITPELEPKLYEYLIHKGFKLGAIMHGVGGIENHTHVVFSLPPKFAVADFIGQLKGSSSHWVTHVLKYPPEFQWQEGYGVLSFGDRHMKTILRYVKNQKKHHQKQRTIEVMEKWCDEEDGVVGFWDGDIPPGDETRRSDPPGNESPGSVRKDG